MQNPLRATYQSLLDDMSTASVKGPNPLFDNVTAIFSATPVITRTATYVYACTEWIEDAFKGRELLHQIYSRLLNPTSICLANHIVHLEAGPEAADYFAWNFNSGMAAIDTTLAHLLGSRDIVLSSRNVYGGTYQLLHDWYGKKANLDVAVEWFDGEDVAAFATRLEAVTARHADRLREGRNIFVYLESPCNPHGSVLDVPGICRLAHQRGLTVICDATIGTPFLQPTLRRADPAERPDFVIQSYTKDLCGSGNTTAGVVIARTERMFLPKGSSVQARGHDGRVRECRWDETMFWNVYYVKGAFLDSDKAFEVLSGMRTAELRILTKCINTIVLSRALARHPLINAQCAAVAGNDNAALTAKYMTLGLPAPLFTIDFEGHGERGGRGAGRRRLARAHEALLRQSRAGLRPAGQPRPGQHAGAVPGADQPFGNVRRGPARGRHLADHGPHQRRRRGPALPARAHAARGRGRRRLDPPGLRRRLSRRPHGRAALPRGLRRRAHALGGAAHRRRAARRLGCPCRPACSSACTRHFGSWNARRSRRGRGSCELPSPPVRCAAPISTSSMASCRRCRCPWCPATRSSGASSSSAPAFRAGA